MVFAELLLLVPLLATDASILQTGFPRQSVDATVQDNELVLKSANFPHGCCQSSLYNIVNANNGSCVKITFDDFDLPPEVSLKIYNVDSKGAITMIHRHQSSNTSAYKLLCPSVLASSLNSSLQLIMDSTDVEFSPYFTGFKLRYWHAKENCLSLQTSSAKNLSDESCHVFATIPGGQLVRALSIDSLRAADTMEYVWTVKVPNFVRDGSTDAVVFGRILDSRVEGRVTIRRDVHSDAEKVHVQSADNDSLLNPLQIEHLSSSKGFYIRAAVRLKALADNTSGLTILTGIYSQDVNDAVSGWISCSNSSWYIPPELLCDFIPHCPLGDDEQLAACQTHADVEEIRVFLKWLLPLAVSVLVLGILVFLLKQWFEHKIGRANTEGANQSVQDTVASQTLLSPAGRATAFGVPLPAARVSSSAVCIPIAGSVGTSGSYGTGRTEANGSRQHASPMQSSSIRSRQPNGEEVSWTRSAPISIPTARAVRPEMLGLADDSMVPPSYEEVTAEHSCGESSGSAEELPDPMEYHPPSYDDASQGKTELVSSWVSSRYHAST